MASKDFQKILWPADEFAPYTPAKFCLSFCEPLGDPLESVIISGSVVLNTLESLTPPGQDTNLLQASPQQKLELILLIC